MHDKIYVNSNKIQKFQNRNWTLTMSTCTVSGNNNLQSKPISVILAMLTSNSK